MYMFFTIQINLYPFILLSVRFPNTVKYWARLHRAAMTNVRKLKGLFPKVRTGPRSRVLARLASLAQIGELARRL